MRSAGQAKKPDVRFSSDVRLTLDYFRDRNLLSSNLTSGFKIIKKTRHQNDIRRMSGFLLHLHIPHIVELYLKSVSEIIIEICRQTSRAKVEAGLDN